MTAIDRYVFVYTSVSHDFDSYEFNRCCFFCTKHLKVHRLRDARKPYETLYLIPCKMDKHGNFVRAFGRKPNWSITPISHWRDTEVGSTAPSLQIWHAKLVPGGRWFCWSCMVKLLTLQVLVPHAGAIAIQGVWPERLPMHWCKMTQVMLACKSTTCCMFDNVATGPPHTKRDSNTSSQLRNDHTQPQNMIPLFLHFPPLQYGGFRFGVVKGQCSFQTLRTVM